MKRTFLGVLLLYLACIILPAQAKIIDSGTCGNDLTWTLTDDGALTISGKGKMYNYGIEKPWLSTKIKKVLIKPGVTSIGNGAFYDCKNLTSINIPESVKSIGNYAFSFCI